MSLASRDKCGEEKISQNKEIELGVAPMEGVLKETVPQGGASLCAMCYVASVVSNSVTPWTVAHQTTLSMGFSRQEYWGELPCSPPGHLPDPGVEPTSLTSSALASALFTTSATWEARAILVH